MNYSTIFATSAAAERFAVRAFGFSVWAIALTALAFINGCANSLELGRDARAWWDATGRDWCAAEVAPWVFSIERCWSDQNLPATLAANTTFWAEVKADCFFLGDRAVRFAVAFTNKACVLSTAGVRLLSVGFQ
jgi:hypothetical protein